MANPSKTISISGWPGSNGRVLSMTLEQLSQDPINNQSTVQWTASAAGDGQDYNTYFSGWVAGSRKFDLVKDWSTAEFPARDGSTSGTVTLTHASDGTGYVSFAIEGYVFYYEIYQASDNLTLTTIDRSAPSVSVTADEVTETGFTIRSSASPACDTFEYTIDGGASWHAMTVSNSSASAAITGLTPNQEYTIQARARRSYNHVYGTSAAKSAKTLGPSVITEAKNVDIGSACQIKWIPYADEFKYKVKFTFTNWTYESDYIEPGIHGEEYTYTGCTFPMSLCEGLPDSLDGLMVATLYTYDENGDQIGNASTKLFHVRVPASVVPSFTKNVFDDVGQTAFTNFYVQNASKIHAELQTAGAYGSTVVSAGIRIGEQIWTTEEIVEGVATIDTDVFEEAGEKELLVFVNDSRGRTFIETTTVTVKAYRPPAFYGTNIEDNGTSISLYISGKIVALDNQNAKHIKVVREKLTDGSRETIADSDLAAYRFLYSYTDSPEKMDTINYNYEVTVSDSITSIKATLSIHPGRLYRFEDLDEGKYYTGMDEEGWKMEGITGRIEDGVVIVEREDEGDDPAGIGFPIRMKEGTAYELIYGGDIDDDTYVFISFFDKNYRFISSYDYEKHIPIGTNVVAPEGTTWGILILGRKGAGTKSFGSITLREYLDPVEEEIEWFLETGNLGLDTPYQKYISRIQLRIDYHGTLKIEISYDNDPDYSVVHTSECDHMRSITVPIRVKRNDHFRIRLSGVGQMRMYSFGYDTDNGGARCLI